MNKNILNVFRGFATNVDTIKDGTYEEVNMPQIGTISGVFKYWVNAHEIQWHNKKLVNPHFGAILRGDKFKLSVKVVSQDVLNTLPKGDYKFENLKAKVVGFYYKKNEDRYGTGWLEKQYVYELHTDYVFTIVATEQYINGYRLLTFYPNIPFIEGTEYIKEIDPKYALITKDSFGNTIEGNFHLQDLNFHDHFKVFKNDEYIGSTNFKNVNNPISFNIFSNNQYNYHHNYIRSLIMNPTGLQYSIDLYDIGYTEFLSSLLITSSRAWSYAKDAIISSGWNTGYVFNSVRTDMNSDILPKNTFSKGDLIFEVNHERCNDAIAIDDYLLVDNKRIPITSYKYYYFTTKDTFLGKHLNGIKIQQQDILKKDFGCKLYYVKDNELITTTLNMKSCMEVIYNTKSYTTGRSSCMIHKFILNNETFYIADIKLVYLLNCLTTGQIIKDLNEYNNAYLTIALDILKKYNYEPVYFDYTRYECEGMFFEDNKFVPCYIPFTNTGNSDAKTRWYNATNPHYQMKINKLPYGELIKEDNDYYYVKSYYKMPVDRSEWMERNYPIIDGLFKIKKIKNEI